MPNFAKYAWLVDYDYLDKKDVDILGPRNIDPQLEKDLEDDNGTPFKMYDDDGELYYSGRIVGDFEGLEPLMDYGMPNAGAVRIDLEDKDGNWQTV